MVSIIVPVYNGEKDLNRCIESIVDQTFKDIEIILINDGSSDNSEEICLRWQEYDNRIIYVKKKNEGQGVSRNLGVSMSKGKYITFVDCDDWIEKDAIESMYRAAEKTLADIVVADINYVIKDKNDNWKSKVSTLRINGEALIDVKSDITLIDKARLFLWGKLYRREFYVGNNICQASHAFEDTLIIPILIAKAETIYRVTKPLYNYYRNRIDSTVNSIKYYGDMIKTLEEMKEIFEKEELFDKYYEVLKKISYSQVRFIYKKLLGDKEEIDFKYRYIIDELYDFMDSNYKEWINIDKYKIGIIGDKNLRAAVLNLAFNESRVEYNSDVTELFDKDILVIDLINIYSCKEEKKWVEYCRLILENLKKKFKGKQIILVKYMDVNYKYKELINSIYDSFLDSNLNISLIEINRCKYDENIAWDLSDEILKRLEEI